MSIIGVAILGSAAIGAGASIYGATQQVSAEQSAQQQLVQQQQQAQSAISGYLSPYTQFGQQFMPTLSSLLQPGPNQNATLSQLPGFQFAQDWGQKGVAAQATTRGLGGNALAAGAQFGTGLAQQNYSQYVSQLLQGTQLGAGAAGQAAAGTAGLAQGFAPAIAQTTVGQGNALAGGAAGVAGAASGGLNSALNLALLNKLGGGGFYGNTGMTNQSAFQAVQNA